MSAALPSNTAAGIGAAQINSNSVLVALLDSHYTELGELVEKALLLATLEDAVGRQNITIFAPRNEALERDLDPEFKRFLLEPRNLRSLQTLLLFHVLPHRIPAANWPEETDQAVHHRSLALEVEDRIPISREKKKKMVVGTAEVIQPDAVIRPDGVIHGIERLLVPRSVQEDFNRRRSLAAISAVLPTGAPVVDPRTHRLKKPITSTIPGSPPALPIFQAMSPGPSISPAPAPGPDGAHRHFDGESQVQINQILDFMQTPKIPKFSYLEFSQVKDFIHTLLHYGGYNELADILVNLTAMSTEMGRLVSEGYVLTVLAPNDEAMSKLTMEQLSEPGAPEQMIYYHLIPEYQTEESMYNAVRRFGKVKYDTLRLPHKIVAREADGSVKFGQGEGSAYLFDPDIYTDGRISVQGIDAVLFSPEEIPSTSTVKTQNPTTTAAPTKRGNCRRYCLFYFNLK